MGFVLYIRKSNNIFPETGELVELALRLSYTYIIIGERGVRIRKYEFLYLELTTVIVRECTSTVLGLGGELSRYI